MERYRAAIILPIIEAFSKGELIELKYHDSDLWEETNTLDVDSDICIYRIKPKPKLVPFTFEDNKLFRDKWIYSKINEFPGVLRILSYNNSNIHVEFRAIGYSSLLRDCEFEDGSPCGKYINE